MEHVYTIKIYSSASLRLAKSLRGREKWREKKWLKAEEKRAAKWEIIGNDLIMVWERCLITYLCNTNFFCMASERSSMRKQIQFTFTAFGFWCYFFVVALFIFVFVPFGNFVWPLSYILAIFFCLSKYFASFVNKMVWFAMSNRVKMCKGREKKIKIEYIRYSIVWRQQY